ncbi:TPA: restriction endonuclease subunit S [Escherichia coli]|nr:restriction endonuclease subunit S [Escherichia coli]MCT6472956.1 restriction endonuclease subunit S [Escherichia coli]MCT6482696.1 restriction endonuclease subunit S [Escherichia coli]MCT6487474.1 restriction endonuclease subunit S [Escherichia coli]MCT6492248.1 restriction endonuclease subunit S [Escherichia coli]
MSELSYLEKLLDGIEVEWVTLGSMADIGTGSSNRQDESENGIYPFYVRSKNILKSDTFEFDEVAIVIPGEGGIGDIFHYVEGKYALHQRAYRIRITTNAVDTKFLYYFMSSSFKQYILTKSVGATAISIRKPMLEGFKVPIPSPDNPEKSLAIQSEIVRILDTFTALTAELTAELNMRKKQYNYYRDQLLSFKEGEVEWKALGEIGEVRMCKRILKSQTSSEGEIPFYKIGTFGKEPDSYISRKLFNEFKEKYSYPKVGEVLISASGTIGRTVIFDGRESYFQDSNIVWIENNEKIVLNKYLFYFYKIAKWGISEGGTIKRLYNDNLRKLMIPVPFPDSPERSLVEQQKIVKLLDKFDALTNSITEGLPREIELRQKQYEYYRDLLFSFPKPETVSN